ncbi:MAG TPA: hypothetical protein VFV90_13290 [Usitatibacter sp.]|nr:hypothetical protein [Usitatibacter sp.]
MKKILVALVASSLPAVALAAPPNACEIVKAEEINKIAVSKVERVQVQKSGNPSQCGFLDGRKAAVLTVSIREVQYAVKDEIFEEKSQLEKIYKSKAKDIDTVGDGGYWHPAFKQLGFRKGKTIVNVKFNIKENQSEVDTAQIARMIEARIPKN